MAHAHRKSIPNIFHSSYFAFRTLWGENKIFYLYAVCSMLLDTIDSFALILFPKYLLDGLAEYQLKSISAVIAAFCLWQCLHAVLGSWAEKGRGRCLEENRAAWKLRLMEKLTTLRQEQMEDPGVLERYEFAKKCIEKGNLEAFVQGIFSVASSVAVVGGVFFLLWGLPIWVWMVMALVILTNTVVHILGARNTYQEMQEETPVERNLYYLRGRLMRKEYAKEIRSYQMKDFLAEKTARVIEDFFHICQKYNRKQNRVLWWACLLEGVQTFSLYAYNVLLFASHSIQAGSFMGNVSALFQFSGSVGNIFQQIVAMAEQGVYLDACQEFLGMASLYRGRAGVPEGEGYTIEFQDVSFRYPGQEQYALEHVDAVVRAGERVSIVGANGAGKSTFVKLLTGLYKPASGRILVNGIDVEELGPQSYISLFATVMQDYQIYSLRILDNLLLGKPETEETRRKVAEALEGMGLKEALGKCPDGLDTYLTQRYSRNGVELSGGEGQKLAIARAVYRNASILVLDEPTSALSPQSEQEIYSCFGRLARGKTVLYISHRLSSCLLCDRILVFAGGRIAEEGSHEQLMGQGGLYAEMFQSQASLYGI